jgi:hypothetical protein
MMLIFLSAGKARLTLNSVFPPQAPPGAAAAPPGIAIGIAAAAETPSPDSRFHELRELEDTDAL